MWNKKKQLVLPNMRNVPKAKKTDSRVRKVGNRYSLASPQVPSSNITHNTSTPMPAHSSQSLLSHTSSPIRPSKDRTPISYTPPEEFLYQYPSPIPLSPVAQNKPWVKKKKKRRPKLPKVRIFHPKKSDRRKNTKKAVALVNSAESEVVAASSEGVLDEAPLPKRRRIREIISKRRGRETEENTPEENTPNQFPCKSVKVVGGSMVDLRVIYKRESASWSKTGDISYSVGTTTEQFKWGLLEIMGGGVKPTSLSRDWMVFHLISGSVEICLDSQLIGTLETVGDTFLVPPESTYEFHNSDSRKASLTYMIIILT